MDQTGEQDETMSLYRFKLSLNGAAQFLGLSGSLASFLFILGSLDVIYTSVPQCHPGDVSFCRTSLAATVLLLANVGMFVFSSSLVMKVKQNDIVGLKALIKTGCYIVASLEAAVCLLGLASLATTLTISEAVLTVLQWASPLLYILIMLLGVTKSQPRLLSAYIIFKIVHFSLLLLAWMVVWTILCGLSLKYHVGQLLITGLVILIVSGFYYVFSTGFSVIHYNILLSKTEAEPANPAQIKI